MINVALAKSNLLNKSKVLMQNYMNLYNIQKKVNSSLTPNFYLLKHRDIPRLIDDGVIQVGITSMEWVREYNKAMEIVHTVNWCDTRVSIIAKDTSFLNRELITCVTEFPNITKMYFKDKGINNYQIYYISGSSETMVPEIFDCCIDCIETGNTIQKNNLVEIEQIFRSSIVIITRMGEAYKYRDVIGRIITCIDSM